MSYKFINDIIHSNRYDKWLLNGKYTWTFLDEYTFDEFTRDPNSPSYSCRALGNIFDGKRWVEAELLVQKNEKNDMYMSALFNDPKHKCEECHWNTMITVVDAERVV